MLSPFKDRFKSRDRSATTPPRLLYNDLESALQSIAPQTTDSYVTIPNRIYHPPSSTPYSAPQTPKNVPFLDSAASETPVESEGSPHIDPIDIGVKFPSLSYGEGIPRRVFKDPTFTPKTQTESAMCKSVTSPSSLLQPTISRDMRSTQSNRSMLPHNPIVDQASFSPRHSRSMLASRKFLRITIPPTDHRSEAEENCDVGTDDRPKDGNEGLVLSNIVSHKPDQPASRDPSTFAFEKGEAPVAPLSESTFASSPIPPSKRLVPDHPYQLPPRKPYTPNQSQSEGNHRSPVNIEDEGLSSQIYVAGGLPNVAGDHKSPATTHEVSHAPECEPPPLPLPEVPRATTKSNRKNNPIINIIQSYKNEPTGQPLQKPRKSSGEEFEDLASCENEGDNDVQFEENGPAARIDHNSPPPHMSNPKDRLVSSTLTPPLRASENDRPYTLQEYAWSPLPSEDGSLFNTEDEESASTSEESQHPRQVALSYIEPANALVNQVRDAQSEMRGTAGNDHGLQKHARMPDSATSDKACRTPNSSKDSSTNCLQESSSVRSYRAISGFVSHAKSSRPMSEAELHQSLSDLVKRSRRAPSPSISSSGEYTSSAVANYHAYIRQFTPSLPSDVSEAIIGPGPGSSQSFSSFSAGSHSVGFNSRGRLGHHKNGSSSKVRSPTPPLLFGRRTALNNVGSFHESRPSLLRSNSRLARAAQAAGIRNDGRLGRAMAGSAEQDWITETDVKTSREYTGVASGQVGNCSSLADNSDSGSSSQSQSGHNIMAQNSSGILQHPPHPRYNGAWTLVKDQQTGQVSWLPEPVSRVGNRLSNDNAPTFLASGSASVGYQHPTPLSQGRSNPFNSSPPDMSPGDSSPVDEDVSTLPKSRRRMLSEFLKSHGSNEIHDEHGNERVFHTRGTFEAHSQNAMISKDNSDPSSAWLSTVDEGRSVGRLVPARGGSFGKVTVLSQKGNLTGTPEGTGAREVGSSLADASSPPPQASSPFSLRTDSGSVSVNPSLDNDSHRRTGNGSLGSYKTPTSALEAGIRNQATQGNSNVTHDQLRTRPQRNREFASGPDMHRQLLQDHSLFSTTKMVSGQIPTHKSVPLDRSITTGKSTSAVGLKPIFCKGQSGDNAASEHVDWLKHLPPTGRGQTLRLCSPCRHRSSSESETKILGPPMAEKVSTLTSTKPKCHKKRCSAASLLKRKVSSSDDDDLEKSAHQPKRTEQREHQRRPFNILVSSATLPYLRNGIVHTNVSVPIFNRPLYSETLPWNRPGYRPDHRHGRLTNRTGQHARPITRLQSPHLHRLPHYSTREDHAYHKHVSRLYMIFPLICPPFGMIYGYGFMDGIMAWHTHGAITEFRREEKVIVLVYTYSILALALSGIALVMVIIGK